MTKQYQVKAPDGTIHIIEGPEDATQEQILNAAAQLVAAASSGAPAPAAPAEDPGSIASLGAGLGEGFGKTVLGAQSLVGKGVRALGGVLPGHSDTSLTTLVTGQKTPGNFIERAGDWLVNDAATGRANLASEVDPYVKAHPLATGAGQVGGEIVATLPVGGAIGKGLGAAAEAIPAAARVLDPLAAAASSGGLKTGIDTATAAGKAADLAARAAGGAMTGGAGTLLVDPDHAAAGATIGAAVPPALKGAAAVVSKAAPYVVPVVTQAANSIAATVRKPAVQAAHELQQALDISPGQLGDIIDRLRNAQTFVPGSTPTVSQTLQMPQASILERVVGASPGGTRILDAKGIQSDARNAALGGVAPVNPSGFADARENLGRSITNAVVPAEKKATADVTAKYNSIDPTGTEAVPLPTDEMAASVDKYLGPGSFGKNNSPRTALATAEELSAPEAVTQPPLILGANGLPMNQIEQTGEARAAQWAEVNRLRASLNEQWQNAADKGDKVAAAALAEQKVALDKAINENLSGPAYARWIDANDSHAAKMDRFHEGPQGSIFKQTNPARGGEVPQLFWGNRPGLADDVDSFRKLVDNNPALLGQFRSMITTDAAGKAAQGDVLGQKFVDWTSNMLPGLKRAFDPKEVETLQNIAADVKRAASAANLGRNGNSDTYQNAANALDGGLWDLPIVQTITKPVPFLGSAVRDWAETAAKQKARRLADLLVDPKAAANALAGTQPGPTRAAVQGGLSSLSGGVSNALTSDPMAQRGALSALEAALQPGQQ